MSCQVAALSNCTPLITGECFLNFPFKESLFDSMKEIGNRYFRTGWECDISAYGQHDWCCFRLAPIISKSQDELSDEIWNSLSHEDNFHWIHEIHHKGKFVPKVTNRLFHNTAREIQEIAKNMGAANPAKFAFKGFSPKIMYDKFDVSSAAALTPKYQIEMSAEFVYALNGWPSRFSVDQTRGMIAHEIAHGILQHQEKTKNIIENNNPSNSEIENLFRNSEIEADLLTTTVSEYGRGLRNALVNYLDKCGHKGFPPCAYHFIEYPTHPATIQRIDKVSEALCAKFPDKNKDICPHQKMPHSVTKYHHADFWDFLKKLFDSTIGGKLV